MAGGKIEILRRRPGRDVAQDHEEAPRRRIERHERTAAIDHAEPGENASAALPFGDAKVFGKPIGGDIVNNKKCWLTTHALEKADDKTRQKLLDAMSLPVGTTDQKLKKITLFKDVYQKLHVDEDAKYEILRLTGDALEYASKVCTGVRYEMLRRFADKLIGRTK